MDELQRKLNAFAILMDSSFGTLWWVKNTLWQQDNSFVLKEGEEKNSHPGVSLRKKNSSAAVIPMLLGCSKKSLFNRTVVFKMNDASDRTTTFGTMKPLDVGFLNFLDGSVWSNSHKRKLSAADMQELEDFIREKLQW
ncbi:MAG: hypothetical protein IKD44_02425 [Lentisphaeria bacterium]|nr:hypothetical protein [Lentisphaeria bacterium]